MMWLLGIIGAYLVGSIPFGVLIAQARGVNIREHGSRNIGATNVGRVLGKPLGIICFLLDVGKGAAPVLIVGYLHNLPATELATITPQQMLLWLAVAMAAVLGHMFSVFLRFGGGKGVATSFGALLAMWPLLTIPTLIAFAIWIIVLAVSRYISVASMIAAVALPVAAYFWSAIRMSDVSVDIVTHIWPIMLMTIGLAMLVVLRHRSNIVRITRGEEPTIGAKRHTTG